MAKDSKYIVVLVTVPSLEEAEKLARALVSERLAACVNIIPQLRSIYRWKGEVCDDQELLLVIKSRAERFGELKARVLELHSYDVPEVIALPVVDGHADYLSWLDQETSEQ